jgi:hypothetical protein
VADKPKVLGVTGGAVALSALALAFGACCVAPWAVGLLGAGGAVLLARLAALLRSSTSRLYWNPTGDFGRQMSHVLHYWDGHRWVYAWDTWLIYPPDAAWNGAAPPEPAFLMHRLGGLPHTAQFPHLDSRVFAAKVRTMIDGLGRTAASQ